MHSLSLLKNSVKIVFLAAVIFLYHVSLAHAATVQVTKDAHTQTRVTLSVYLNPEKENINAVSGELIFPEDIVAFESVSTANSIIAMWIESPKKEGNKIIWSGIIPGGFTGVQSSASEGRKPGKLFSVTFIIKTAKAATISFERLLAFLNDGNATAVSIKASSFQITGDATSTSRTLPEGGLSLAPEITAFIANDPLVAEGKWFVVFNSNTSEVSITQYEIAETYESNPADVPEKKWKIAQSPYVLAHQSRSHFVHIKAIAQDEKSFFYTLTPSRANFLRNNILLYGILGIILAILLLYRQKKKVTTYY